MLAQGDAMRPDCLLELPELVSQKGERAIPGKLRARRVEQLRAGVVEECVTGVVLVRFHLPARHVDPVTQGVHCIQRNAFVPQPEVAEHWHFHQRWIDRDVRVDSVEVHSRIEHVGMLLCSKQGELAAHAETEHAHLLGCHGSVVVQEDRRSA